MYRISSSVLFACSAASAQIVNGGFESGSFPPWVTTPTAAGVSGMTAVVQRDIDGPGPLPTSFAARFMVGRTSPGTSAEGIILSQPVVLSGGADYRIGFNWSVWPQVNIYNASGGTFELLVDGVVLTQAAAPITIQNQITYGQVSASFHAPETRSYTVGVRITRTTTFGEEVFQYLDNIVAISNCRPNCDGSTTTPVLTANDFQCFINAYAGGPVAQSLRRTRR